MTTEWTSCEKVHAQIRNLTYRIQCRHLYQLDEEGKATPRFVTRGRSPIPWAGWLLEALGATSHLTRLPDRYCWPDSADRVGSSHVFVRFTILMPSDSSLPGQNREDILLPIPVLPTVKNW